MSKVKWHTRLFDDLNEYWAEISDSRDTNKEIDFIETVIHAEGLVLDLCCGTGRHASTLSSRGLKVLGYDISPNLLRIARQRMKTLYRYPVVRGDMQHLPFKTETFAAAISMFTSFGYLPSEGQDLVCFLEVARTLKEGGQFLVDVVNRDHLFNVFQKKDWGEFPSFYMMEKRVLAPDGARLHSRWTMVNKKDRMQRGFDHDLRLYSRFGMQKLLQRAGLRTVQVYGDYEGHEIQKDSPRLIVLAEKG
jgi:SAM-dependent methyltransferase